jgi:hypothetical protein
MYGFRVVSVIASPGCTRRYRYAAPAELKIIFLVLFPGVGTPGYHCFAPMGLEEEALPIN